jgi:hypothetical protein
VTKNNLLYKPLLSLAIFLLIVVTFSNVFARDYSPEVLYKEVRKQAELRRRDMLSRQLQTDLSMSIFTRKQSEYDPLNIKLGSLLIEPSVSSSYGYTDNIYETDGNEIDSYIFLKGAGLKIRSDLPRHLIESEVIIEDADYIDVKSENYRDYKLYAGGRVDVAANFSIPFALKYSKEHVERNDVEDTDGVTPTLFYVSGVETGFKYLGGVIGLLYNVSAFETNYDNNSLSNGTLINNKDRNRVELSHTLTINTAESGRIAPFIFGNFREVNYSSSIDDFGIDRDSSGWAAGVGSKITFSGLSSSTIKYGKMNRDFDDASLKAVSEPFYGIDVNWEPTTLLGLNLSGQRFIDESGLSNASASVNSSIELKAVYELAPNIYLYPEIKYLLKDYQSTDNREVERINSGLKMTYKMNRNIWGTAIYENSAQEEIRNGVSPTNIDVNKVLFSLKLQL